jgi:coenzyme F420-reducing hydrogenase gamma subunit
MKTKKKKLKAGIFAFTCCEGCQLQILDLWDRLVQVLDFVEIEYFKLAQEDNVIGRMDLAIVEGAIATKKEAAKLEEIRKNSGFLVAIGECAVSGGIPAMRTVNLGGFTRPSGMLKKTTGIDSHVKVDYRLRGCPIEREEFLGLVVGLAVGKVPQEVNEPVCVECNNREIECLMLKGTPCAGPLTCAGCDALCPAVGTPCEGCRGTMEDAAVQQVKDRCLEVGASPRMAINAMERFSSARLEEEMKKAAERRKAEAGKKKAGKKRVAGKRKAATGKKKTAKRKRKR